MEEFVKQMAGMSLPEEETGEIEDISCDRLYGEYLTFMEMVRQARELLK